MSTELKWIEISSKFCLRGNQISLLNIIVFAVIIQTTDILDNVSASGYTGLAEEEAG